MLLGEGRITRGVSSGFLNNFIAPVETAFIKEKSEESAPVEHSAQEGEQILEELWPGRSEIPLEDGSYTTSIQIDGQLREVEVRCLKLSADLFMYSFAYPAQDHSFFHQQRLQTLGLLAGGVAHDFNNILAGILGHITFLQAVLPSEGAHCESLEAITEGAKKASELTKQILDFSKFNVEEENAVVGLSGLIQSTAPLLRGALTSRVQLHIELPKSERYVTGSEGKLAQVLVNLVINARDAVSTNGEVTVRVRDGNPEEGDWFEKEKKISLNSPLVVLEVIDNGVGMSEQVRQDALKPYFSTKGEHGTGLGLATVASIVEAHNGVLHIDSALGEGTNIQVILPLLVGQKADSSHQNNKADTELPRGNEHILVVDDEEAVRNVVAMSLRHLGYHVTERSDPREVLSLMQDGEEAYDLIVLDMLMPHHSGEELFIEARKVWQDLPVLIMSGYSDEGAVRRILDRPNTSFIHKPFTVEDLSVSVRKAIDKREPR